MCNALKSPQQPVWLLHGGDHFTILFAASASAGAAAADPQPDEPFVLHHWNGLPPHGPRMATVTITGVAEEVEEGEREDSFKPPVPGEIENIVQAVEADKKDRPDMFETWRTCSRRGGTRCSRCPTRTAPSMARGCRTRRRTLRTPHECYRGLRFRSG